VDKSKEVTASAWLQGWVGLRAGLDAMENNTCFVARDQPRISPLAQTIIVIIMIVVIIWQNAPVLRHSLL
jgi:hypothetical protein